jgi:AmmeMemoRadiSam system protein B
MPTVRPAAVAGSFYPAPEGALRAQVAALLAAAQPRLDALPAAATWPKAYLLPHAGYIYSGSTAALGYAALARHAAAVADGGRPIRRVVLLGPTHRVAVDGLALPGCDAFQTPLGQVGVEQLDATTRAAFPQLVDSAAAHAKEHSLEVHLPFLQTVLPEAVVVPLAVGRAEPGAVAEVIDGLWDGPQTVLVVSSDLSHFHRHEEAVAIDSATVAQVLRLDGPVSHEQACGATPLNGLLVTARRRGMIAQELGRCTSGDTAGDRRRVVGYAALAFTEPRTH